MIYVQQQLEILHIYCLQKFLKTTTIMNLLALSSTSAHNLKQNQKFEIHIMIKQNFIRIYTQNSKVILKTFINERNTIYLIKYSTP